VPKSPTNTKKNPVFYHVYMEELEAYLIKWENSEPNKSFPVWLALHDLSFFVCLARETFYKYLRLCLWPNRTSLLIIMMMTVAAMLMVLVAGMGGREITMEAVRLWRCGQPSCGQWRDMGARGIAVRLVSFSNISDVIK
jgi:hypothetical protein